jgi:hypothetical protein
MGEETSFLLKQDLYFSRFNRTGEIPPVREQCVSDHSYGDKQICVDYLVSCSHTFHTYKRNLDQVIPKPITPNQINKVKSNIKMPQINQSCRKHVSYNV